MAIFGAIQTSATGLRVFRTWLDAVSDNIANMNTVRPMDQAAFQERFVVAQSRPGDGSGVGGGAEVAGVLFGNPDGRISYQPEHPMADENGYVRFPDIDLGSQMSQLLMAQRGYQANLAVVERARDAYAAALNLGRA